VSAYGYDSRRRRKSRRLARWAATRRTVPFWLYAFIFITLAALTVFAITYDHMARPLDFPTQGVTSSLAPHPATPGRHP
jgi:lysylphosphatidylglycerol synthetase-like protein (DUF2156 family)